MGGEVGCSETGNELNWTCARATAGPNYRTGAWYDSSFSPLLVALVVSELLVGRKAGSLCRNRNRESSATRLVVVWLLRNWVPKSPAVPIEALDQR